MKAEDLFEAMGELDEELIARSDRRVRSGTRRKRGQSSLYRFTTRHEQHKGQPAGFAGGGQRAGRERFNE